MKTCEEREGVRNTEQGQKAGASVARGVAAHKCRAMNLGRRRSLRLVGAMAAMCIPPSVRAIGGTWFGRLTGEGGLWMDVEYRFSAGGRLILDMAARSGVRSFEIKAVGQHEKWLLPGSGYGTLTVSALSVTPQLVQVVNAITKDQTLADGLLFREEGWFALEFTQHGRELHVTRHWRTLRTTTSSLTGARQEQLTETVQGVLRPRA